MIRTLGKTALGVVYELGEISLFGLGALRGFAAQRHRLAKLVVGIHEIGVRCLPIVVTVGLFTGLVMGLQLYYTLVKFGAESALGTAVALSLIRELGPVLTALMVVGQAGSALMRDEKLVASILSATVKAVEVPVTLKIRTGWSPELRNGVQIARR